MRTFACCLTLFVAGCASGPVVSHKPSKIVAAQGPGTATVYLNRPTNHIWSTTNGKIFLDGKNIGVIKNGQCVRLTVPGGAHRLYVVPDLPLSDLGSGLDLGLSNLNIKPGQAKFFRARVGVQNGAFQFLTNPVASGNTC